MRHQNLSLFLVHVHFFILVHSLLTTSMLHQTYMFFIGSPVKINTCAIFFCFRFLNQKMGSRILRLILFSLPNHSLKMLTLSLISIHQRQHLCWKRIYTTTLIYPNKTTHVMLVKMRKVCEYLSILSFTHFRFL